MKKALTALGFVAAVMLTQVPAANAVGCWGDYCSGLDPDATGCSAGAQLKAEGRIAGTYSYVQLFWSPTCQTNWARASWSDDARTALHAVQCATGYTQGFSNTNGTYYWSKMIYSPRLGVSARWSGPPGAGATSCS